jgi:uncharacterized protein (TIGR01777 family)
MKILVAGSSGLVGSALCARLARAHSVRRLVRRPAGEAELSWDPASGRIDDVSGFDAVVHLGGENLGDGRWTEARKRRIEDSRVTSTALLAGALATRGAPKVFLCASAIGYYGDRGDAELTEDAPAGHDFLSGLCERWEQACAPAVLAGTRVARLRLGMVLSSRGGGLRKMLLPFKMGLGGPVGSGRQWVSWIGLTDAARAIEHLLDADVAGPVNLVSPEPIRNRELARALGRALGRSAVLPLPGFVARALLGETADALLLSSLRVLPERLLASGFVFETPSIGATLALEIAQQGQDTGR